MLYVFSLIIEFLKCQFNFINNKLIIMINNIDKINNLYIIITFRIYNTMLSTKFTFNNNNIYIFFLNSFFLLL